MTSSYLEERNLRRGRRTATVLAIAFHAAVIGFLWHSTSQKRPTETAAQQVERIDKQLKNTAPAAKKTSLPVP